MTAKKLAYLDDDDQVPAALLPGTPRLMAFPFDYSTAGLAAGYDTGFTPAIGDYILAAWIDVTEAFDGTTPLADFGFFAVGDTMGMYKYGPGNGTNPPVDLAAPWAAEVWMPKGMATADTDGEISSQAQSGQPWLPTRITESHPIKIVASQTGEPGGTALNSTTGSAVLCLLIATPAGNV